MLLGMRRGLTPEQQRKCQRGEGGECLVGAAPRPQAPEDLKRNGEIVATLREVLSRYGDYRDAERDGF